MRRAQSYSSINLYSKCPRQWEWRYVHGQKGPPNQSADRGTELHALLEDFFNGGPYPSANKTLAPWRRFMENLLQYEPTAEAEWVVLDEWVPCDFIDQGAYMRGKVDLTYIDHEGVRHILDWKSGRMYDDHKKQGMAYVALDPLPTERYATQFVYLDLPVQTKQWHYSATDRLDIKERLTNTIDAIALDNTYEPTPSRDACRYCPLSFKKGGNCTRAI
jgi:CRISPR/Cas system-associated exonuclease Cas4 (RecB family)